MVDALTDPVVVTMVGYFAVTIAVGLWFGRNAGTGYVEFTLAGRNLSLPVYMMTYFATFTGGGLTMGIAQQAFVEGISAQWYAMTQGLAWMTMTLFIGFIFSQRGNLAVHGGEESRKSRWEAADESRPTPQRKRY